jgi:hypothetical protein
MARLRHDCRGCGERFAPAGNVARPAIWSLSGTAFETWLTRYPEPRRASVLVHCRQPAVDLGHGEADLLASGGVRSQFELALQFSLRQSQRLGGAGAFRIHFGTPVARSLAAFFQFFHALLQARISVNQSFSSITHE